MKRSPPFCRDKEWMRGRVGALCLSSSGYGHYASRNPNGIALQRGQAQGPHIHSTPPIVPTGREAEASAYVLLEGVIQNGNYDTDPGSAGYPDTAASHYEARLVALQTDVVCA